MPQAVVGAIKMVALVQQAAVPGRLCLIHARSVGIVTPLIRNRYGRYRAGGVLKVEGIST